jgi:predicted ribosomally synthesized peptide with nif11-like leader
MTIGAQGKREPLADDHIIRNAKLPPQDPRICKTPNTGEESLEETPGGGWQKGGGTVDAKCLGVLTNARKSLRKKGPSKLPKPMSEDQLLALLAKLKDDTGLREKLQGAADLDAAVAIANEAGFDLNKEDWLKYQTSKTTELSDADLEVAAGGAGWLTNCGGSVECNCVISGDW